MGAGQGVTGNLSIALLEWPDCGSAKNAEGALVPHMATVESPGPY